MWFWTQFADSWFRLMNCTVKFLIILLLKNEIMMLTIGS